MHSDPQPTGTVTRATPPLDQRSRELRQHIITMLEAGNRGHLGSACSLVEILRVLYDDVLNVRPAEPHWHERDRCILSKGHGCLALYAVLGDKGFFPQEEMKKFCHFDGILGGHPEFGKVPGVEASTGSLGHGLSLAVGRAMAARISKAKHRVYAVISDGECNEGSTWEAALCAAKHQLSNLTILIDYNKQQSYGATAHVLDLEPLAKKWEAFRFAVTEVDGHNVEELRGAIRAAAASPAGTHVVVCHTVKGKGFPFAESNPEWHHKNKLSEQELRDLRAAVATN